MRKKDYFSFEFIKKMRGGSRDKKIPAEQMTHANPHTQSPKLPRDNVVGNNNMSRFIEDVTDKRASTVMSVSGKFHFLIVLSHNISPTIVVKIIHKTIALRRNLCTTTFNVPKKLLRTGL